MTISPALARRRDYAGPALFAYGFRPFFLGAAIWAAFAILVWLPVFFGEITLPISIGPLDWHMHEMLYGFVAAVMGGFLLTAIPNWTGRLPVSGLSLAALAGLWLAGRAAQLSSGFLGALPAAVIDVSFLAALLAVALREIITGKNWRNLPVLAGIALFGSGNVVWHAEIFRFGTGEYGPRIAVAAVILMITLIGGRIVPSFTRNWLVRVNPGRLPKPFARFDAVAVVLGAVALALWAAAPHHTATTVALLVAGAIHAVRLSRWAGDRTLADRLVLVLHVAYAFVPVGFVLLGIANLAPAVVPDSAAVHAWTAGAIGLMTLAVMTRASLGHTGQALVASPATQAIYALALISAAARIAAAFTASFALMHLAALAWVAAFGGFALAYGPTLITRPPVWAGKS